MAMGCLDVGKVAAILVNKNRDNNWTAVRVNDTNVVARIRCPISCLVADRNLVANTLGQSRVVGLFFENIEHLVAQLTVDEFGVLYLCYYI